MIEIIAGKAKGLLTNPVGTFQKSRAEALEPSILYFAAIVLVHAVFSLVTALAFVEAGTYAVFRTMVSRMGWAMPLLGIVGAIVFIIVIEILAVVFAFILGGWLHICVYALGGRKGYVQTVKVLIFGSTPYMLIGWIPVIGPVIGGIWSLVLGIIGLRELQEMSTGRSVGAVVLAIVIAVVIVAVIALIFAALFLLALFSSLGSTTLMRPY
jgi:hypothetical protein